MKEWTLFKKAALTTAVSLALTQSVWAMPTGGVVKSGNVSGFAANPASGATFTANGDSIINWDAFGIAAGEILNFNTANGALLNRVTGNLRSDIFGTLTQTGAYPMFLVNPNGILVGNGATINASNIVLSTLEMTNDDFLNGSYKFATPSGKTIAAPITVSGANINISNGGEVNAYGGINLYGGTVEVADGVTFATTGNNTSLKIYAAAEVDGVGAQNKSAGNTISIDNSKLAAGQIKIDGGTIAVSNHSDIEMAGEDPYLGDVSLTASAGDLSIRDSNMRARYANFQSPRVTLDNADIQLDDGIGISDVLGSTTLDPRTETSQTNLISFNKTNLHVLGREVGGSGNVIFTGKTFEAKDSTVSTSGTAGIYADSAITLNNTNLNADYGMYLTGGKVDIANSRLTSPIDNFRSSGLAIKAEETNVSKPDSTNKMGGHSLTLTNTTVDSGKDITIEAGKVVLDGTTVKSGEDTRILAAESMTGSMSTTKTITTAADSAVEIKGGSTVSANQRMVIGGREVSVTGGSTVSAGTQLSVGAGTAGTIQDYVITMTGTPGKISVSTDSKLLQNGADVTDSIATNRIGPTPTPTPNPNPAPTPEIPTAKTLAENVENGRTAMSAVLANNITVEARKSGAKMLIESINRSDASGAVKSAKTTGVLLAILEDESLTDTEKVSLQREIVQTFHPTQIANAETNHTIENTAQTGTSAATGDNQPQNTKRTFPAEEMPIIKGV